MFGFSRRRMRIGRLKVQLAESTQGTRSPIRHSKRSSHSKGENSVTTKANSDELNQQSASSSFDLNNYTSGNSENWMVLSIQGENPAARFNHAATVIGNKMLVVGGDSGNGLLEDVQVLNFDKLTWTVANAKAYFSPTGTPLKIPPCRGHCLVSWGKKVLLIGGKTAPASDKLSVWAFDTETNCWSRIEAKGDIPVARIGHSVIRSGSVLILFGGEDVKGRKKSDLHMFDLQSLTWLPLHCTGTGPSARSNHTACLYDDRVLFIFGGTSKSRTLNDLYSLDFETMMWSRMKIRGFHPSARSGSCGVLSGTKWYITGGGSRKKRYAETLVFDVVKAEWSVAATAELSSVTSNKGFSLVSAHHRDKIFLIAYGGTRGAKKEPSNQVEFLVLKNDQPVCHERNSNKSSFLLEQCLHNHSGPCPMDPVGKQNLASSVEHHGSGRKSLSDSFVERNSTCGSISLRKQLKNDDDHNSGFREDKCKESDGCSPAKNLSSQAMDQRGKLLDPHIAANGEETHAFDSENLKGYLKQLNGNGLLDVIPPESETKSISFMNPNIYQMYENKLSGLIRKNGVLEGQLSAALSGREAAEKNLASVIKNRQELERRLEDTAKEMEQLKEKLASMELAHEEANSLSNIVHSDNVRLEHDVAFLKAVLDDTQKELHSTRGVLAGERARAFQLQVEVFHLKQRFQTMENRAPTPRKPFPV